MKSLFVLLILSCSLNGWSAVCDLSINNARVVEIDRQFDEGQMNGENHYLALREAGRERMSAIESCLTNDQPSGISLNDLKNVKEFLSENLAESVSIFNTQISFEISMDRVGMATELMMERDIEKLRVANLIAKIDQITRSRSQV